MRLSCIVSVSYITAIQFSLRFRHNSFKSNSQNFPVFHSNMSYTIIKIIPRCKNVMLYRANCLRCHIRSCKFAGCFSFPVLVRLPQLRLGLLCNVKRICCSGCYCIQFSFQPFIRKFRECLASSWCDCTASHDQLIITDNNRNIMENMSKRFRSSRNDRFSFCFLI